MAAPSQTKSGTQKLSEVAKKVVAPSGISSTGWPAVRDVCLQKMGVEFDPWQDGAGRLILAKREDGKLASMIGGVGMSLPRQVGKTYLIGAMVFALCILRPGMLVIWSAHHARTHGETFLAMQDFAKRRKVRSFIRQIFTGSGDEEIRFLNGSRILFGARERGFGRGIPGVDMVVADEAQIMSDKALDAQLATMNTSDFGLAIYVGTPPRPDDPSEAFTRMRDDAWAGRLEDGAWIEFGADDGCRPDDRAQWSKANPSHPKRTPVESILRLQRKLSADSFLREGLGVWDDGPSTRSVISAELWRRLGREAAPDGRVSYGVKFSPDGETVALAVAVRHEFGIHVEGLQHTLVVDGTQQLVDWLAGRWESCGLIVVDGKAGSGAFVKALLRAKVQQRRIVVPTTDQAVTAHAALLEAVTEGTLSHIADPVLDQVVTDAGRRQIGKTGGWGFQSLSGGDVTLLDAVTCAHYAALTARTPKTTNSGRRAVVM